MGVASAALGAASGLVGGIGSIAGGFSQSAADKYQAQVARSNAGASMSQANAAQAEGDLQAQSYYQQGSQKVGAFRAAEGASGVQLNSGSALAGQQSIARTTALNINAVKYDADGRAVGYLNQTAGYDNQASQAQAAAKNAITSGWIGGATSLIGSASSVASKWDSFKQVAGNSADITDFSGSGDTEDSNAAWSSTLFSV